MCYEILICGKVWETHISLRRVTCEANPDSKVHGANMGPIWVLSTADGPHVAPINLAIWENFAGIRYMALNIWKIFFRSTVFQARVLHWPYASGSYPAKAQRNEHVIITSKRRFT